MRGEHTYLLPAAAGDAGSSPHARGAPLVADGEAVRKGIIPACAGSTVRATETRAISRDHPRMRGEHVVARLPMLTQLGSSPHARGALVYSPA